MTDTVTNSLLYPGSYDFLVMRSLYVSAAKHISLKFEVLNDEFKVLYARNPMHHIETRVKSLDSITAKLRKKGSRLPLGLQWETSMILRKSIEPHPVKRTIK